MSYENPEDEADELAKAFLESRNMEHTRSYLERGRSYEELSKQELETKWVAAGNAFIGEDDQGRVSEFRDLDAEYRLRELEAPAHLLKTALDKAAKRFSENTEEYMESAMKRMEGFIDDLGKPKN